MYTRKKRTCFGEHRHTWCNRQSVSALYMTGWCFSHSAGSKGDLVRLEETLHVAHFHDHSLQLGVVLDGHLAVLSAKAWWDTAGSSYHAVLLGHPALVVILFSYMQCSCCNSN